MTSTEPSVIVAPLAQVRSWVRVSPACSETYSSALATSSWWSWVSAGGTGGPPLTVALTVTVRSAPGASAPKEQVTVAAACVQVGAPGATETKVRLAGTGSVSVTLCAVDGPSLRATRV